MTQPIEVSALPKIPESKFYIGQHEPLCWLVSTIFTDEFWQRDALTQPAYTFETLLNPDLIEKPRYENRETLYAAIEEWIDSNSDAKVLLLLARQAIKQGELAYLSPEADEWGEKPYHEPNRDVDSYTLLIWAERQGYVIPKDVIDASYHIISSAQRRKQEEENQAYGYPIITSEDFERLRKQPLWEINTGLFYLMGRRCRGDRSPANYSPGKKLFCTLTTYAEDAHVAEQLKLHQANDDPTKLKVAPEELIKWAKTLPLELTMLTAQKTVSNRPDYCTADMKLMYDAVEKFWGDYDLNNPNPNIAPMKKDMVDWLLAEAQSRGIQGFSKTRAENMDTIMRCPAARKGGNTL